MEERLQYVACSDCSWTRLFGSAQGAMRLAVPDACPRCRSAVRECAAGPEDWDELAQRVFDEVARVERVAAAPRAIDLPFAHLP